MIKGDDMNDLEKKVRAALILCVIVVGIYLAGKCKEIWERESDGQGGRILGQAYVQAGTLAAGSFLPVLSYGQEQTPEDFFSAVLRTVGEQFPILSFQETDCGEEEIIEDAETAEAIREENEKLIAQKLEAENQAQAVTEENQQAQETQSDGANQGNGQETSQIPEGTATQKQVEIPREQLTDFNYLLNNFFVVDPTTTALESQINVDTLLGKDMKLEKNPEESIKAAVKYLELTARSFDNIPEEERINFTLASYNSGIGHVLDAMALAEKYGSNKYVWRDNVEKYILLKSNEEYFTDPVCKHGYFRGRETYNFVRDIMNRYEQYKKKIPE